MQAALLWPLAAFLGLFVGSYLNVVAWRWYRSDQESPQRLTSRSKCPHCGKVLGWRELVPVVSFLVQRGRCAGCATPLSIRYPLAELGTAAVFGLAVARYGIHPQSALLLVIASIFVMIALVDAETQLIPDRLSLAALIVSLGAILVLGVPNLIGRPVTPGVFPFEHGVAGGAIAAGILGAIVLGTRGRGMGIGDIKLGAVLGLSLGGPATLLALFTAFVTGAAAGLLLIRSKHATLKTAIPFGPFLVLGWLVAALWATPVIAWYTGI